MGELVIAAYRPKAGQADALLALVRNHVPALRALGYATDRPHIVMRGQEGVVIEVFEWRTGGSGDAHTDPDVLDLWSRFAEVCNYAPLATLTEAEDLFATFTPVDPA